MASLASVTEYRSHGLLASGASGGAYVDADLQRFLDRATTLLESACYQSLRAVSETEIIQLGTMHCAQDSKGVLVITPRFFPVNSVASIKWRLAPDDNWTQAFDQTDYSVQDFASSNYSWGPTITVPFASPFVTRGQWGEVQITYNYGYATIPDDIKEACIDVAYAMAMIGLAAIEMDTDQVKTIVPPNMWKQFVQPVISRYGRKF